MALSIIKPKRLLSFVRQSLANIRKYSDLDSAQTKRGLVLGVYTDEDTKEHKFTPTAEQFNNSVGGKLGEILSQGNLLTKGKANVFQNIDDEFYAVAVVGLGKEDVGYNPLENLDECSENIRIAAATGALKLKHNGINSIYMDPLGNAEAAAEGAGLALWENQNLRNKEHREPNTALELFSQEDKESFERGLHKADAQNFARRLSETPGNLMTPTIIAQQAVNQLCPCGVSVEVRDKNWAVSKKMFAFLAVARGSAEPPVLLDIGYCRDPHDTKPIVFIGKGITYGTGGLCIKTCEAMPEYRADMAGAAVVLATIKAAAQLNLPINLHAIIPLCENMMSGMAMKPGDVVRGLNGKTIQIDNTDHDGRLLLADALVYAHYHYKPKMLIDIGTYTNGMKAALGNAASGVFTENTSIWNELNKAGAITGDRLWRFPLWDHFTKKVTGLPTADVTNQGWGPGGGPCRAAAFLREFVQCDDWVHIDISSAGMKADTDEFPYLLPGRMTGRPTRTIVQFLYQLSCSTKEERAEAKAK